MNSTFTGKKIKGSEIQWKDTVMDPETNKRYWSKWLDGTLVCLETHEPDIDIDYDKEYLLLGYPANSKRAEESSGEAIFVSEDEIKSFKEGIGIVNKDFIEDTEKITLAREERKYPISLVEMEAQKHWDEWIALFNYVPKLPTEYPSGFTVSLKVNRKYKCSELEHYLKGKKNIYLRIADVKPPFEQKVMMLFESMSNGHVSVIIDQDNKARAGYPDYLYRLVQICKINKNKTK